MRSCEWIWNFKECENSWLWVTKHSHVYFSSFDRKSKNLSYISCTKSEGGTKSLKVLFAFFSHQQLFRWIIQKRNSTEHDTVTLICISTLPPSQFTWITNYKNMLRTIASYFPRQQEKWYSNAMLNLLFHISSPLNCFFFSLPLSMIYNTTSDMLSQQGQLSNFVFFFKA